jgi:hypothetical protein
VRYFAIATYRLPFTTYSLIISFSTQFLQENSFYLINQKTYDDKYVIADCRFAFQNLKFRDTQQYSRFKLYRGLGNGYQNQQDFHFAKAASIDRHCAFRRVFFRSSVYELESDERRKGF